LILGGSISFSGGTDVNAGTLIVVANDAIPDGTSLTVGSGGTLVFDSTTAAAPDVPAPLAVSPAAVIAVPEPDTLALLIAGLVVGPGVWQWNKSKRHSGEMNKKKSGCRGKSGRSET
jgi:autotransporter-associated beta strand protein